MARRLAHSPERDHISGNVLTIKPETEEMIWAAEAGGRSLICGAMAPSGQRKITSHLVDKLEDAITKK